MKVDRFAVAQGRPISLGNLHDVSYSGRSLEREPGRGSRCGGSLRVDQPGESLPMRRPMSDCGDEIRSGIGGRPRQECVLV